jgi:hypothetical protein
MTAVNPSSTKAGTYISKVRQPPLFEKVIADGINRAEVQKQRCEKDESGVSQKTNCQIQIPVSAERCVEVKYKSRQAQADKMQNKWSATTLPKDYKQPDAEIDEADEIDIKVASGQIVDRAQVVEVCVIVTSLRRVRGALDQVMNLTPDVRLIQIHLNVLGSAIESHLTPRVTSSHFWPVMLTASKWSPGFMRALAAAEPGAIDLATTP